MVTLYTIGFTNKSAEKFFQLIEINGVKKIIDTRISNASQLSGFAKGQDLAFFAKKISDIEYEHKLDFAPTKDLLDRYRKKQISWSEYEREYLDLLRKREIEKKVDIGSLDRSCLLCSEHSHEKCHRRLLAEYLQTLSDDVKIVHLK